MRRPNRAARGDLTRTKRHPVFGQSWRPRFAELVARGGGQFQTLEGILWPEPPRLSGYITGTSFLPRGENNLEHFPIGLTLAGMMYASRGLLLNSNRWCRATHRFNFSRVCSIMWHSPSACICGSKFLLSLGRTVVRRLERRSDTHVGKKLEPQMHEDQVATSRGGGMYPTRVRTRDDSQQLRRTRSYFITRFLLLEHFPIRLTLPGIT